MEIFGISFSASDIWLFSACGALVIVLIQLRFTTEMKSKDIFNAAAKEFTDMFHRELKEIYPTPVNWPPNIDHYLRDRFNSLNEAVGKFERHLHERDRKAFNDAWFRYYCCTGREVDRNCQCYLDYCSSIENGVITHEDTSKTYKQTFKNNVAALLEFAKPR